VKVAPGIHTIPSADGVGAAESGARSLTVTACSCLPHLRPVLSGGR
jgi:hypothetical protein